MNIIITSTVYAHTYKGGATPSYNMFHKHEIEYKFQSSKRPPLLFGKASHFLSKLTMLDNH